jgi:hypothetical protein
MRLSLLLMMLAAAPPHPREGLDPDTLLGGLTSLISPPSRATRTDSQGIVIKQTTCISKESPEALAGYFATKFKAAGLYFPPELKKYRVPNGSIVSALDTENLVSHTAWLQPNGKYTTILLTEADVSHVEPAKASEQIAPLYPGATDVMSSRIEGTKTMTYQTTATPAQVRGFYTDVLSKDGYAPQSDQVWYVKGDQRISIHVSAGVTKRFVVVSVVNGGPAETIPPHVPVTEAPITKPQP